MLSIFQKKYFVRVSVCAVNESTGLCYRKQNIAVKSCYNLIIVVQPSIKFCFNLNHSHSSQQVRSSKQKSEYTRRVNKGTVCYMHVV